jgi:hypothetical protein
MNIQQVQQDILQWSETFVEVPHPALGGWPPCPFARQARLTHKIKIMIGTDPYYDMKSRASWGMGSSEVIVYAYDPAVWSYPQFSTALRDANQEFLLQNDLLALEDHPADAEIVNGVCMNQGTYALALVQSLSKLNSAAQQLASKGFYHTWPDHYLEPLFAHRRDPRS